MRSAVLLSLACACTPTEAEMPSDAVVYSNATFLTLDSAHPRAAAVRVEKGRITDVYDAPPPESAGRRVDLGGSWVLPGIVDAHFHLRSLGAWSRQLSLKGTR